MVEVRAPDIFSKMAYDRAIVVFSPEGRLYQVEYAQKAVENAPTAVGVVYEAGVVLMAMKIYQKLLVPEAIEKIAKIEDHIGIVFCGMAGDARALIDYARLRAQIHRITYNEPISTKLLARQIANRKQQFTQIGGIRPYGVSFLIGGYNEGPELYETDPAGTVRKWYACAIGRGAKAANEVLEREWKPGLAREKAISLAAKALKAGEKVSEIKNVDAALIEKTGFRKVKESELKRYF